jgi:predicted porin
MGDSGLDIPTKRVRSLQPYADWASETAVSGHFHLPVGIAGVRIMKKKILAASLVIAFTTPVAMADVTFYGLMTAGLESVSATGNSTTPYLSRTRVADENSYLGFKGTEDLGNGLRSVWQVESSLKYFEQGGTNDAGQQATFATRNSFVGLDSASYGSVLLGLYDTAYKRLTNVGSDLMANTSASVNGASNIFSRGETRLSNSVHYTSALWNGFQAGASWGADETRKTDSAGNLTNAYRLSLGAAYSLGGLKLGAGYDRLNDTAGSLSAATTTGFATTATAGRHTTFAKLAASYTFTSGTYLGGGFERASYDKTTGGDSMTQNDWTVAASQDIGRASVKLSYSKLGSLSNVSTGSPDDYAARQLMLALTYNLSKTTQLFTFYTRIQNNALANVNLVNTPLYTSVNTSTQKGYLAVNDDPTSFGIGMKMMF